MTKKMNTKMSKLALCALLSAGVVSAVNGEPTIVSLLWKDDVQLFNELKTREACENALKRAANIFPQMESGPGMDGLSRLTNRLNFLCVFWKWFDAVDPDTLRVEKIFSEDCSEDQDLRDRSELIFLRDAEWGDLVVGDANNKDCKEKFGKLKAICKGFI